jgi:hypothetical protein
VAQRPAGLQPEETKLYLVGCQHNLLCIGGVESRVSAEWFWRLSNIFFVYFFIPLSLPCGNNVQHFISLLGRTTEYACVAAASDCIKFLLLFLKCILRCMDNIHGMPR